jgi:hypothetical protein
MRRVSFLILATLMLVAPARADVLSFHSVARASEATPGPLSHVGFADAG